MNIYYRIDSPDIINVEYVLGDEKIHDFFQSKFHFSTWIEAEHSEAQLIEITDENYQKLKDEGKVS